MRSARAFMVLPSSMSCFMLACLPVSTTCSISPLRCTISARSARMSRVPWVMTTLPVNMQRELAWPWLQSELSESSVIGWLRSLDLAWAGAAASSASAASARAAPVRRLTGCGRFIAGPDLREEAVLARLEVGFQPGAGLDDAGLGQGDLATGTRQVLVGQQFQAGGVEGRGRACIRVAAAGDAAFEPGQFGVGADPAMLGAHLPGAATARDHEQRGGDIHALVLAALQARCQQAHGLGAVAAQHHQFEIAQHVIGAL